MRIALVQDYLRMGGTEQQSVLLANAFAAAGHDVLLLTLRPGGPLAPRVAPAVRHLALQKRDVGFDWFAPGFRSALRAFRPDIVQLMGRTAHFWGRSLHTVLPAARVVGTFRTGKPIPRYYESALRRAALIVANSREAAARVTQRHRVPSENVRVIHNAVAAPEPLAPGTRAAVRREIGTPEAALVFVCVAMLRPEKGHRDLLRCAAQLDLDRPWELWIAGDGAELSACRELAHSFGLADRVRFLGLRSDVHRLYAAADVAVLSSHRESLPNFLVEAQWLGLPVVAYDTGGVGETFAPDQSGILVAPHSVDVLREGWRRLACDDALRASMSAAAREHAHREFDPARQNQRYLDLFDALHTATASRQAR